MNNFWLMLFHILDFNGRKSLILKMSLICQAYNLIVIIIKSLRVLIIVNLSNIDCVFSCFSELTKAQGILRCRCDLNFSLT